MEPTYSLPLSVARQPDPTTCGPTCLQAMYRFFGDDVDLSRLVSEVTALPEGGTLAVWLGCHALARGYATTIYTYNLQVFDPSWFPATPDRLTERLEAQRAAKADPKLDLASRAYVEFLSLGGDIRFEDLTPALFGDHLRRGTPLLAGLSATYLYRCARERADDYDDIRGEPVGHFVVINGFDPNRGDVMVADPLHDNPGFDAAHYRVPVARVIGAILLGIVTYDANLLALTPRTHPAS